MLNLLLCHWSSQLFDLRAPSSTDVPVLLLNQPIVCTKLKVRKFKWLATRVCRSVISIQYRPQALQHLHERKFCADFHTKNSYVNVYMSPCRPFTCKFECIFKVTDFGCKNTCKLLISLQCQQIWLMKN